MLSTHVFQRTFGSWILLALVLVTAPVAARAEAFFDIYFGGAFPEDSDVDVDADDPFWNASRDLSPPGAQYSSDVEWDSSPSMGMRGGYWFEGWGPSILGAALDLSYYHALEDDSFASLDVYATPITPLLMLRIPLGYDEEFPGGRVSPYGAVGPAFTFAAAHADLDDLSSTTGGFLDDFDDATFAVGFDARAGLAVALTPRFALFGEYRYTYVEPEFEDEVDDSGAPDFDTEFEIDPELTVHHLVFGASFRF